jgi:L-alanine-DL-glutamate epimerase-like enolase superfamily enzyme
LARITLEDGFGGFGSCRVRPEVASALLGVSFGELFSAESGALSHWRPFEYPIWDLAGKRAELPVYALAAGINGTKLREPYEAPCYDTSLYFDDLHLSDTDEAADLMGAEAREGYERGHRAFKIKVGRGARHMPLEEGTERDIAIIRAVREAVGLGCPILLDANNGYNLNLTKRVLDETADCGVFWMEEAFHEDPVLYHDLKEWMSERGLSVLIADGEGQASPSLLDWAKDGLVDVIQYDIHGYGFNRWLETGRRLDEMNVRSAPHHYGGHIGNYTACHLAGAIRHFSYVEWDEATTPGLDGSRYVVQEGRIKVPDMPGFGLGLDEEAFSKAVSETGFTLQL